LVERWFEKPEAVGSIPIAGTIFTYLVPWRFTMEQKPLQIAFKATEVMLSVLDVSIPSSTVEGEKDLPYSNSIVRMAMQIYVTYVEMREWYVVNRVDSLVEEELVVFIPGGLFAVMQQHPKWESRSWFQGRLFDVSVELHRVPEDENIYWGYRGDEMIVVFGRINPLNWKMSI